MFLLLLSSIFIYSVNIQLVKGTGTIYIRADGSIDPPTANITTADNVTYRFTNNNYDSIVVERSNIIVDGNGFTLQGSGYYCFDVNGVSNVTIKNTNIDGQMGYDGYGIRASSSCSGIVIAGNNITTTSTAIFLFSSNSTVTENNIASGTTMEPPNGCINIIGCNNTVSRNNVELAFWNWHYDNVFGLYGACHNFLSENNVTNGGFGFRLVSAKNNTLYNNYITNCFHGIHLDCASHNILRNNTLVDNYQNFGIWGETILQLTNDVDTSNTVDGKPIYYGVSMQDSTVPVDAGYVALVNCTRVMVQNLELAHNFQGLFLGFTTYATIKRNNITENEYGIMLMNSTRNSIYGNTIENNRKFGIHGEHSWHHNCVFHNNINDSIYGIYCVPLGLSGLYPPYHDRFCLGGNFWSDYVGVDLYSGSYQNMTGDDGIGDSGFLDDDNPLMRPWTPHNVAAISLRPFKTSTASGTIAYIDAVIINRGDYPETFNVTVYANETQVDKQQFTLEPRSFEFATFMWNTTGMAEYQNYIITARTFSNNNTGGTITIAHVGDITGDGKVDIQDVARVSGAFGSLRINEHEDPRYSQYWHPTACVYCPHNPNADINGDGKVDITDVAMTSSQFGWHR